MNDGPMFQLGVKMGGLETEVRRNTEITLSLGRELRELPDRMAKVLSAEIKLAAAEIRATMLAKATTPANGHSNGNGRTERLKIVKEIVQAALPLAIVVAVIVGRMTWAEGAGVFSKWLAGISG